MRIAYLDLIGGLSGDMLLGAWLDAGLDPDRLREAVAALPLPGLSLQVETVLRGGLRATRVEVREEGAPVARSWAELRALLEDVRPTELRERLLTLLGRLAETEARLHGRPAAEVHLHEVGGADTVVDTLGTLLAVRELGIESVYASPVPFFRGSVSTAHGRLPLPAPATLELLKGAAWENTDATAELVTPTGALLLSALAQAYGPPPPFTLQRIAYGAGARDDADHPNVLRLLLGETPPPAAPAAVQLETNLDDLEPEILPTVLADLLQQGALDAFLTPVLMKKGRPGYLLTVLAPPETAGPLAETILRTTGSLGVRSFPVRRLVADRGWETVTTPYGPVRVKVGRLGNDALARRPEFADCEALARRAGVPVRLVYEAALRASGG